MRSGAWWTCGLDVLDWIGERVDSGREFFESGDEIAFAQDAMVALRPAHHPSKRAALTQPHLSIPVTGGRMSLGTWQGLYVFEHRATPHRRRVTLHLIGEGNKHEAA